MICDRCLKEITLIEPKAENGYIEQVGREWRVHYGDGTTSPLYPSRAFAEGMLAQETKRGADSGRNG